VLTPQQYHWYAAIPKQLENYMINLPGIDVEIALEKYTLIGLIVSECKACRYICSVNNSVNQSELFKQS